MWIINNKVTIIYITFPEDFTPFFNAKKTQIHAKSKVNANFKLIPPRFPNSVSSPNLKT